MKANQRLNNLYKTFGADSDIYNAYKIEIEGEFKAIGRSDLVKTGPKGAIKLDYKKAAYEVANMKRNERNLFSGAIGSVPTIAKLREDTAKRLGIKNKRKVTTAQMEANHHMEDDFKASIQALYNMLQGDDYRSILVPELYQGNHGKIENVDEIKHMIDFYSQHPVAIKTARKSELESLRKQAERYAYERMKEEDEA